MPKLSVLALLPAALKAKHVGRRGVSYLQVPALRCQAQEEIGWLAVDGELYRCPQREAKFSVDRGALSFLR
jgi:hypothetical protein